MCDCDDCYGGSFYIIFCLFGGVAALVNIGLMLSSIVLSYQQDLGDFNLEGYGIYAISALVELIIFISILGAITTFKETTNLITGILLFIGILIAIQMIIPVGAFKKQDKELIQAISFKNWRIDYQYAIFEKENSCEGLKAAGDQCGDKCCDDKYISTLDDRISLLKNFHISAFALQLVMDILWAIHSVVIWCN